MARKRIERTPDGATRLKIEKYLVIGENGSVSIRDRAPSLKPDEISTQLLLSIPTSLFRRPRIRLSLDMPEGVSTELAIDATEIQEAVSKATGVQVELITSD